MSEITLGKVKTKATKSEMLPDSFMYRNYFNGVSIESKNVSLYPPIATSRNLDDFVAKELSSGPRQSTNHRSKEGPRSRSNESLSSSKMPHSMNLELVRLETFKNFPNFMSVSAIKLAKEGFYYIGQGEDDLVICFACKLEKRGWGNEDIPREIHQQMAPKCPLLNEQSVNVPVGGSLGSHNRNQKHLNSKQVEINHQHSKSEHLNESLQRPIANQKQINAFLRELDPLGINFDGVKYPEYAVLATRVSSFQDWPNSLTQTPQVLALAGFSYAGYGDYTRCFLCGGGLQNWEPGDDPWTEHARWFPKCAFVRQNKGDEFVALVRFRHQEIEALKAMEEGATAASLVERNSSLKRNRGLLKGLRQSDITVFPSFQSVREMGYTESEIREAFNQLRATKYPEDITGMDLMEVILSKEDRNNGLDIPPPIISSRSTNENQFRNLSFGHIKPYVSQGGQFEAAIEPTPQDTSKSWAHEQPQKYQNKDAATSNTEDFDSINDALAPAISLEDTRSLKKEKRKLRDLRMCKICMENDAFIAMLPCGHLCCCADCACAMRKCPIQTHFAYEKDKKMRMNDLRGVNVVSSNSGIVRPRRKSKDEAVFETMEWSTVPCTICADCTSCCRGCFCIPCMLCDLAERLGEWMCFPFCVPCGGYVLRIQLRTR